ncbi:MAG: PP2C family protein-serine/threonine phosphatase [Rectinemataceae bacterium]
MMLQYSGITTRGKRKNNEDAFAADGRLYFHDSEDVKTGLMKVDIDEGWHVFAIADGMGGHASGEIAARSSLQLLCQAFGEGDAQDEASLREVFDLIHAYLLAQEDKPGMAGMGCTLTGAALSAGKAYIFNIGDSRTYQFRSGYLSQVTKDHSLRSLPGMSDAPQNQLMSSLGGGQPDYIADVWDYSDKLKPGQALVMSSDGYHEFADIDVLEAILAKELDVSEIEKEALAVQERGSTDNTTLLVLALK